MTTTSAVIHAEAEGNKTIGDGASHGDDQMVTSEDAEGAEVPDTHGPDCVRVPARNGSLVVGGVVGC